MTISNTNQQELEETLSQMPAHFAQNVGQQENYRIHYYSEGTGYNAYFTSEETIFTFFERSFQKEKSPSNPKTKKKVQGVRLDFRFLGANSGVKPEGKQQNTGKINYLKGSDPTAWQTNISTFQEVVYPELWSGIDLVFKNKKKSIKYEFIVQPGAKVEDIQFTYAGAEKLSIDEQGNLLIHASLGTIIDERPVSYQEKNGHQVPISSFFHLQPDDKEGYVIGFKIEDDYVPNHPIIIDPGLIYSTYLGGTNFDQGLDIAVDAGGNAYVTGFTSSTDFPTTPGAFDTTFNGNSDAFVTKLDPTGSMLIYSTYLGGTGINQGSSIAVDAGGNAYVTGFTQSTNFPTTPGAFDTTFNGAQDAFATKLNPTGSLLLYSTYLGGISSDEGFGIAVDAGGNAHITGLTSSSNFPTTPGAFDTTFNGDQDAFVTKFDPTGSMLLYSTYLGGTSSDQGRGIAVDAGGNAYVTGLTSSSNFPTTPGAFDTTFNGAQDAFVTKLDPTGSMLIYSTYLGGASSDEGRGIAIDAGGNAYVTGITLSANFPTTLGAFDTTFNGNQDAFVTKIDPTGSMLLYSTYLGGIGVDFGLSIAVDIGGNAYVTGFTLSTDFPTTPGAFDTTYNGSGDAFVTKIDFTGSILLYSTYLGGGDFDFGLGIAVDTGGNAYVTGSTGSLDFPTTPGAFDTTYNGNVDAFVTKIGTVLAPTITCTTNITVSNDPGRCGAIVNYPPPTVVDACPLGFTASCAPASGSFFPIGTTTVTCTVTDPCGGTATCSFTITVFDTEPPTICCCDCDCDCCCDCD